MYHPSVGVGATTAATLPFTGLPVIFIFLIAFALLAAGLALWRIVPRREG